MIQHYIENRSRDNVNYNYKYGNYYHGNKNRHVTLVQTFNENEVGYRKRQLNHAKLER